jgi:hypothetical protein
MVVVSVSLPEMPEMVTTNVWSGVAVSLAVSVSKLHVVLGFETHDAVTPLGRADVTATLTGFAKPP